MARAACPDSICARATRGDHGLEQGARLVVPAQAQQQLRANACGIQPVGLAGLETLYTQRGGLLEVLGLDGVKNGFEMDLAQSRLICDISQTVPFTLSLSKPRAALRQAQRERFKQIRAGSIGVSV